MAWTVIIGQKAQKQLKKVPEAAKNALVLLVSELEQLGPIRGTWAGYGKLYGNQRRHHCHLKKGRPTFVAVWREIEGGKDQIIEVEYVGTHEKAPY